MGSKGSNGRKGRDYPKRNPLERSIQPGKAKQLSLHPPVEYQIQSIQNSRSHKNQHFLYWHWLEIPSWEVQLQYRYLELSCAQQCWYIQFMREEVDRKGGVDSCVTERDEEVDGNEDEAQGKFISCRQGNYEVWIRYRQFSKAVEEYLKRYVLG